MRTMFENATVLDHSDADNYAISFGAMEYAMESESVGRSTPQQRFEAAKKIRSLEEAWVHNEQPIDKELRRLRSIATVPDSENGDGYDACYLLRAEFDRMALTY